MGGSDYPPSKVPPPLLWMWGGGQVVSKNRSSLDTRVCCDKWNVCVYLYSFAFWFAHVLYQENCACWKWNHWVIFSPLCESHWALIKNLLVRCNTKQFNLYGMSMYHTSKHLSKPTHGPQCPSTVNHWAATQVSFNCRSTVTQPSLTCHSTVGRLKISRTEAVQNNTQSKPVDFFASVLNRPGSFTKSNHNRIKISFFSFKPRVVPNLRAARSCVWDLISRDQGPSDRRHL